MNFLNKKTSSTLNGVSRATENIINEKEMQRIIDTVFNDLSKMVSKTIGPCGANTLITEPFASTPIFPTKDGYRVMNNHVYNDIYYESIYRIIRGISARTNQELGDGTTTSVVIGCELHKLISKYLRKHKNITPYGAKKILDVILDELTLVLKDPKNGYIRSLTDMDRIDRLRSYKAVAAISSNNDSSIGDKVVEAYSKSETDYAYIDIQESDNNEDVIDTNLGFELATGYVLRHMANKPDGVTAEYAEPLFLLIDGPILPEDVPTIQRMVEWSCVVMDHPLVIIAGEFCKDCMDFFVKCRTAYPVLTPDGKQIAVKLPVIATLLNTVSEYGVSRIQDLEACLGAKALQTNTGKIQNAPTTQEEFIMLVGKADSVQCVPHYIRIRGGAGSRAERDARIEEIERLIQENKDAKQHGMNSAMRLDSLRRRAGMLLGEMHCIKVGGDSYKEKQNRKLIFEDAIQAVKACIKNGVSLGGNVSIRHAIKNNRTSLVESVYKELTRKDKTFNVMINTTPQQMKICIGELLDIVAEGSTAGFRAVFDNASNDKSWIKHVFKQLRDSKHPVTYDLIQGQYECMPDDCVTPSLIVPGNTDIELLRSAFAIIGLFITSNQLLTVHVERNNKVTVQ